jgi:hypothetical protein
MPVLPKIVHSDVVQFLGSETAKEYPCIEDIRSVKSNPREIESAYTDAPLIIAKSILRANGYEGIKLHEFGKLWQQGDYKSLFPHNCAGINTVVTNEIIYFSRNHVRIIPEGVCWNNPGMAGMSEETSNHGMFYHFSLSKERKKELINQGFRINLDDLDDEGNVTVEPKYFEENEYSIGLFGGDDQEEINRIKNTKMVGDCLLELGVKEIVMQFGDLKGKSEFPTYSTEPYKYYESLPKATQLKIWPGYNHAKGHYHSLRINAFPLSQYNSSKVVRGIKRK